MVVKYRLAILRERNANVFPQGSGFGSLLFLISINDLTVYIENTDITMFADHNTTVAIGGDSRQDKIKKSQSAIEKCISICQNHFL